LRPQGKFFGLFESYGWGGGALKEMRKHLEKMKVEIWRRS